MDGERKLTLLPLGYNRLQHPEPLREGVRLLYDPQLLAKLKDALVDGDRAVSGEIEQIAPDGLP